MDATEQLAEQLIEKLAKRWLSLSPHRYERRPLRDVQRLTDKILCEASPEVRLLLILRLLTDYLIMPSHEARLFGHIMASEKMSDGHKMLLCELCLTSQCPFLPALKMLGADLTATSLRDIIRGRLYAKVRKSPDLDPFLQLGPFDSLTLPRGFYRAPLVWSVRLGTQTAAKAIDSCLKQLENYSACRNAMPAQAYGESAVDVLLQWRAEFRPARVLAILEALRQVHDVRTRMAAYRAGTILVAADYARQGLNDRSNAVRKQCELYVNKGAIDKPLSCLEEVVRQGK